MRPTIAGVAGIATVVASFGLAVAAVPGAATAASGTVAEPAAEPGPTLASDNYPDAKAEKRSAQRQAAVDQLVAGDAQTQGKGRNRTIQMAGGTEVDYPVNQTAQLLTFLVDFGDGTGNPAYPDNTAGPVHNTLPEPAANDNVDYWEKDFSRQHYLDMFFNGLADQGGESFHDVYDEMSSGRFDLQGDVSDWVSVDHPESYYQSSTGDEDATSMKNFIGDSADAWYDAQKAAGKSDADIKAYLAKFDVWDRYDYDGDGDYNEPDGYIDHFQAIHAGAGEEAGADPWTIWSHRWAANPTAKVGPDTNKSGGVEIGDTGFWIRDYTTEPENGGLGVFAHEFGHDLGLPDYYDTQGGDNSTAFWTLMSQGSWNGHGGDAIGTTPNHMDAVSKLFLGWYGANDLAVVDGTAAAQEVTLGPSYHATNVGAQAVAVTLPDVKTQVTVVPPYAGTHYLYSGTGDDYTATATSPKISVPATGDATLSAKTSFSIEDGYDYAFLQVSDDGGASWVEVPTNRSEDADLLYGIDGCSGTRPTATTCDNAWTDLTADLSAYAGKDVQLRFKLVTDGGYHELGFSVDELSVGGQALTGFEDGGSGWSLKGFRVMDGSTYEATYSPYYLAENRQHFGYDETMGEGPYSFDYYDADGSAINRVDHFAYQDGLLVWYVNPAYGDNNTLTHPGYGAALPVDANPSQPVWNGSTGGYYASSNIAASDATFDVDTTDALKLTRTTPTQQTLDRAAHPSVPVFDDSDVNAYWDNRSAYTRQYSTKVAGAGAMIQVVSSDETSGKMVLKAGHRFVTTTSQLALTGTPKVGETLTATAPTTYQTGVTTTYQWKVGGTPVFGVTGPTYTVQPADDGKPVSVTVTSSKTGYDGATQTASMTIGTAPTVPTTPTPTPTTTPVTAPAHTDLAVSAPKKVARKHKAKVTVTVTAAGATPTGSVTVTYGGKAVSAPALSGGRVSFTLPKKAKKGRFALVVRYVPDAGFTAASSTTTVRVTRKR